MFDFSQLPFFEGITATENRWLNQQCEISGYSAHNNPLCDYQKTEAYWFLVTGHWQVWRKINGDEKLMFDADRPGTWTGGIPVIDCIAPVKTKLMKPSELLKVPISVMESLVKQNPLEARQLLNAVHWGSQTIGKVLS